MSFAYKIIIENPWTAPDGTDYNTFPVGWREVTEKEYAQYGTTYIPEYIETRQMFRVKDDDVTGRDNFLTNKIMSATLFWFRDKTGWAIVPNFWEGSIRYFRFGCDHEYKELSMSESAKRGVHHFGNCYHVRECKKCGHIYAYDSSG